MTRTSTIRILWVSTALMALASCGGGGGPLDWDFRRGGGLNTSEAARQATAERPQPDARGVISYPGYQVAVAERGDTVGTVAGRVGIDAIALARHNALIPEDPLRPGEILALPTRVAAASGRTLPAAGGAGVDISAIATTALDGTPAAVPAAAPAAGPQPTQHRVARGETAFTIARTYNVSAKALADWNGLDEELTVREGQFLLIPVAMAGQPDALARQSVPGEGSPTPLPPSAADPLPDEDLEAAATARPAGTPDSPGMAGDRTSASAAKFAMPVSGSIIRGFGPPKSLGVDFSASAGTEVRAAADGTVAAVTKDTDGTAIVILRHADNVLTVYGGVDGAGLAKGDAVRRGVAFAKVRASAQPFLHFEVRKGFDAVDPMPYLQ